MRNEEHKWLVPTLVRTVDLVRQYQADCEAASQGIDTFSLAPNMIMNYLQLNDPIQYQDLYKPAFDQGRLLVILDGFDEAGIVEHELTLQIERFIDSMFLVVTSRNMAHIFNGAAFGRFRQVLVKPLDEDQQRQIIRKRLSPVGERIAHLVADKYACNTTSGIKEIYRLY
jgi:hypothetical protein